MLSSPPFLHRLLLGTALLGVATTACAGSDTTVAGPGATPEATETTFAPELPGGPDALATLDPDTIVFTWSEEGGCWQSGPNCNHFEILADGSVRASRILDSAVPATELWGTATIDTDRLSALVETSPEDPDAFAAALPEGTCRGCVDGIDYRMGLPLIDAEFSSVDVDFEADPLFQLGYDLYLEASEAAADAE